MTYQHTPNRAFLEAHDGETVRLKLATGEEYELEVERVDGAGES